MKRFLRWLHNKLTGYETAEAEAEAEARADVEWVAEEDEAVVPGAEFKFTLYPDDSMRCEFNYPSGEVRRFAELIFCLQNSQYAHIIQNTLATNEPEDVEEYNNTYSAFEESRDGLANMLQILSDGDEYEPPIVCPTDVFPMFNSGTVDD